MSEEEIIEIVKKITIKNFNNYKDSTKCKLITKKELKAIQGLLDLYNEEKEKNEEGYRQLQIDTAEEVLKWKKKYHLLSRKIDVVSKDEFKELKEKNESLQKEIKLMKSININDNYISKDKISEKIKELEELDKQYYSKVIKVLKELLEE